MSPEQIKGKRPRREMDLYSLAATAYEMLCGNPPFFRGDTAALYQQIIHEPIEPIETWGSGLDRVLERALAKQPQDRFETAVAFIEAVSQAADGASGEGGEPAVARATSATAATLVDAAPAEAAASKVDASASKADTVVRADPPPKSGKETVTLDGPPARGRPWAALGIGLLVAAAVGGWVAMGREEPVRVLDVSNVPAAVRVFPTGLVGLFQYHHQGTPRGNGTAVLVDVEGVTVALTAHHLFGPNGGLPQQLQGHEVAEVAESAAVHLPSGRQQIHVYLPIPRVAPVSTYMAEPLDVAAFLVNEGPRSHLKLARQAPAEDTRVHILLHDGRAFPARIRTGKGWAARTYVFEGAMPPEGSSGAPILDEYDQVVGLHLGNFEFRERAYGICTNGETIRQHVSRAVSPIVKGAKPPPARSRSTSGYEAFDD
jgi:hypothetical protein